MNKNIQDKLSKGLDDYKKTLWVYKKSSNTISSSNYDPYRGTGYTKAFQSPIPLKVIIHQISMNGLIVKELGLALNGAIEIICNNMEANLILTASKLKYDNKFYTVFIDALGSKTMVTDLPFNMKKIVCSIKGNS